MAMRRPRIKATALLTTKRKSRDVKSEHPLKPSSDDKLEEKIDEPANHRMYNGESPANFVGLEIKESNKNSCENEKNQTTTDKVDDGKEIVEKTLTTKSVKNSDIGNINNNVIIEISKDKENQIEAADDSFKCPARVEYSRSNSQITPNVGSDDVFYTDMEESILHLDMQKTLPEKTASPIKQQARQRIRPVPLFQRRSSFVGTTSAEITSIATDMQAQESTPTPDGDTPGVIAVPKINPITHRRERHYSASMIQSPLTTNVAMGQHHYTPHKFTPAMGLSRIRTESNCSAFSDSFVTSTKFRKIDEQTNRANSRRNFSWRIVNGNLDKSSLKMFDLIYYNPVTNPMEKRATMTTIKKESTIDENDAKQTTIDSKAELTEGINNAMPVPQLKLNANGDLILDEKTLEIETTAEQEARKVLANSSLIFLDENTGMNGFYKRQKRTKEWPPEETIKFYRCLQTIGTDFSLMCQLFPKRTRRDLKLKFKKEERSNLALINKALLYPKLFNIDDLKTQLETEERDREEALQRWKEIHAKEAKTIKKVKISSSSAARALKNGDDVYENENVVKRKLGRRSNIGEKKKIDHAKKPKVSQTEHEIVVPDDTPVIYTNKSKLRQTQVELPNNSITEEPVQSPIAPREITPVKFEVGHEANYTTVKAEHYSTHNRNLLNSHIPQINEVEYLEEESRIEQIGEDFISSINTKSNEGSAECNEISTENNENLINYAGTLETKIIVDLDDGTVNMLQEDEEDLTLMDAMPATPMSVSQRELDECDIQQILIDLAEGSLVLVSTLDPDNVDQVVNEIYMLDKTTGELCDKPLDIPESIVQGVLSVMS